MLYEVITIAAEMDNRSPNGFLLNYANPMAAVCYALGLISDVPFVGLCHGVQTTLDLIGRSYNFV